MQNRALGKRGLAIGQLAERTGLSVSAIRHYEAEGLVRAFRTSGNMRRFDRADIRRLSFVRIAQDLGFSLAEIRQELGKLPEGRTPDKADWARIGATFRKKLDARIATMTALRDKLDGCIGCGCLSMKTCALWNPRDAARRLGSGPRYLLGDTSEDALGGQG
ncbi:MAG: redox-sensitive transcriptional activator SoxR [Paracoccaceae bacterium]|nr:redox-sensitive transcriptional activator SoxR [Paracoccaceae bacterium]